MVMGQNGLHDSLYEGGFVVPKVLGGRLYLGKYLGSVEQRFKRQGRVGELVYRGLRVKRCDGALEEVVFWADDEAALEPILEPGSECVVQLVSIGASMWRASQLFPVARLGDITRCGGVEAL